MKIDRIQFDNVRYNPERGAFETLVKIHDQGQTYSYPAQVAAPLHAEYGLIVRGLAQAASKAHKAAKGHANGHMRLHHAAPQGWLLPMPARNRCSAAFWATPPPENAG